MADTAAHLVDRVFPAVPVRQWVLTLPYPLRYRCAYDAKLTTEVLRAFLRALFAELRRRVRRHWRVRAEQCGAVTFLQRFGSALNLNLPFHTLALDGAYPYVDGHGETPRFFVLPPPRGDEDARVLTGTARRLHRLLESRGDEDDDPLARDEPLLALLAAASLHTRIVEGPQRGEPWLRAGDRVDPVEPSEDPDASPRVPEYRGMSLHAAVAVPARDRRRLERLCRYAARPPLANDRLEEHPDGRLTVRLKTCWRDGTTHVLMERSELIDRLVPLIPPPRAHPVRYHGILAPCASLRSRVVPAGEVGRALCLPAARAWRRRARAVLAPQRITCREDRSAIRLARIGRPTRRPDDSGGPRCSSASSRSMRCVVPAVDRRCGSLPRSRTPRSPGGSSRASGFPHGHPRSHPRRRGMLHSRSTPRWESPGMSTRRRRTRIRNPARPSRHPVSASSTSPRQTCMRRAVTARSGRDRLPSEPSAAARSTGSGQLEIARRADT